MEKPRETLNRLPDLEGNQLGNKRFYGKSIEISGEHLCLVMSLGTEPPWAVET